MGSGISDFPVFLLTTEDWIHRETAIPDFVQMKENPCWYKVDMPNGKSMVLIFSSREAGFRFCREEKLPSGKVLAIEMNRLDLIRQLRRVAAEYPLAMLDRNSPDQSPVLDTLLLLAQLERDEQSQYPKNP